MSPSSSKPASSPSRLFSSSVSLFPFFVNIVCTGTRSCQAHEWSLIEDINSNFLLLIFLQRSQQAQVILSQQLNINLDRCRTKKRKEKVYAGHREQVPPMRRFTATFSRLTLENNSPVGQEFEFQILRWSKFNRRFTLLRVRCQQELDGRQLSTFF